MATRYIAKFDSIAQFTGINRESGVAAPIGVVGGVPYMTINGATAPIGGPVFSNAILVDGDNGSLTDTRLPYKTIQLAVAAASRGDTILIRTLDMDTAGVAAGTAADPPGYVGDITITAGLDGLRLVGVGNGCGQMAQPCIRVGTTTTNPLITVKAPGVGIYNLTINGAGATGGGIKLLSDGALYDAGGATIAGCHFKNCKSSGNASTGGAIYWSAGGCWYVTIDGNDFFDCRCGIGMISTSVSIPRDIKITNNKFYAAVKETVDADIYIKADGVLGLMVDNNIFGTVDIPAYATSPAAARYIYFGTGTAGIVSNCNFASTAATFGTTTVTGGNFPTTVRLVHCFQAGSTGTPIVATAN
jgi:hypothetical protein